MCCQGSSTHGSGTVQRYVADVPGAWSSFGRIMYITKCDVKRFSINHQVRKILSAGTCIYISGGQFESVCNICPVCRLDSVNISLTRKVSGNQNRKLIRLYTINYPVLKRKGHFSGRGNTSFTKLIIVANLTRIERNDVRITIKFELNFFSDTIGSFFGRYFKVLWQSHIQRIIAGAS